MKQQNYTNPEDRGRFGFSASGKYNSPYKAEHVLVAFIIGVGISLLAIFVITAKNIIRDNPSGVDNGRGLVAMAVFVGAGVICVAVVITCFVLIRFVVDGFTCTYIADEEKFMTTVGGTHHTIYYKEVQQVHFLPRTFMGTVRGYLVTIKINGAEEEYGIVSTGYISEKTTPFYIIKERMEMIRVDEQRQREDGSVSPLTENAAKFPNTSGSMMGVGGDTEKVDEKLERGQVITPLASSTDAMPAIRAEVMPSVGSNSKVVSQFQTYIGDDGRERSVTDIIARGTFNEPVKPGWAVLIGIIGVVVYVIVFAVGSFFISRVGSPFVTVWQIVMIIIAPFYAGTIINFLKNGAEYSYRANGREFVISDKHKSEVHILYSDVQSVDYKSADILWFLKGYRVEILTRYGVIKYNYVVPGIAKKLNTKDLPFEVIRERIER